MHFIKLYGIIISNFIPNPVIINHIAKSMPHLTAWEGMGTLLIFLHLFYHH